MASPDQWTCPDCEHSSPSDQWDTEHEDDGTLYAFCPTCDADWDVTGCSSCDDMAPCADRGPGPDPFCGPCLINARPGGVA